MLAVWCVVWCVVCVCVCSMYVCVLCSTRVCSCVLCRLVYVSHTCVVHVVSVRCDVQKKHSYVCAVECFCVLLLMVCVWLRGVRVHRASSKATKLFLTK